VVRGKAAHLALSLFVDRSRWPPGADALGP
jgi:hypothetical protein